MVLVEWDEIYFGLLLQHPTIEIVAINDIADTKTMSHLLKYDSIHGVLSDKVTYDNNHIIVGNHKFYFSMKRDS